MTDESPERKRRRRGRRGGRGRGGQPEGGGEAQQPRSEQPQQPQPAGDGQAQQPREGRRRRERGRRPPSENGAAAGETRSRTHRAPTAGGVRGERPARDQRGTGPRERGGERDRDRGPRDRDRGRDRGPRYEAPPPPQDERSVELGAAFREAQTAVRDARKALDKRRAEFDDEPEWLVEALREAEARFEQAATQWHEHLLTTGRKMARR